MEQTRVFKALQGVRGRKAVDLSMMESLLVRFSQLVVDQRWIKEIDINPLIASAGQVLALDARIVLNDPATPEDKLPRTVIRPYPDQYVSQWAMKDGSPVIIRPIRPEDEPMMVEFHHGLSDYSVYMRYFTAMKLIAAGIARAPDAGLLHRLRPRTGAGGRDEGSARPGTSGSSASGESSNCATARARRSSP